MLHTVTIKMDIRSDDGQTAYAALDEFWRRAFGTTGSAWVNSHLSTVTVTGVTVNSEQYTGPYRL